MLSKFEPMIGISQGRRSLPAEIRGGRARFPHEILLRTINRLPHFFERTVEERPSALALIRDGERLSYADLDARANRLANHLIHIGIRPRDRVGLLLDRSVNAYVGLLAALKCGATFVPLDPSFPADRIAFIAEDAELAIMLTAGRPHDRCFDLPCWVLDLDGTAAEIASESDRRPDFFRNIDVDNDDDDDAPCYIIYTSGTTGRPKGVLVNHSSICNFLDVCMPIYGVHADDRVYQGMTLAFDFSIEEVWPAFASGATLVAGPTDHRRLGSGLADFLIEQRITILCCVPTLLATIDRDIPTLRTLLVGGEACPEDLVRRWCRPGRRMLNTYGPTETTVTATWTELRPGKPVTIGVPLPSYTVQILDEDCREILDGEVGEISIGGPGVAVGYIRRPELTEERFIPDPSAETEGGRLYRTGDLGRILPGGEIEYLGRIDDQVKIRGYRIELGEIESVLKEDDAVSNALVTLRNSGVGADSGELVAYLTLRHAEPPCELRRQLHETLRHRLPAYMAPSYIEILDEIPMLPSGKADRSKLPAPRSPRLIANSGEYVAPATLVEERLAAAWGRGFSQEKVSVEADFFLDLGGHSLFAATLISNLRREPEFRRLGIADLYNHPTVRGLARHVEAEFAEHPATATAADRAERVEPRTPSDRRVRACGAAQFSLLYLALMVIGAPALLVARDYTPSTPLAEIALMATLSAGLSILVGLALPVLAKWVLIGRFRPGRYPAWGWYYCRWWFVRKLIQSSPLSVFAGSPLAPAYARLLGARIGSGTTIATSRLDLPDLIEIGEDASIGYNADLEPFLIEDGWLHLAPIRIGAGAFVGANAVVMLGGEVGEGARVAEQSLVARDQTIPAGETWAGSPSRPVPSDPELDAMEALPVVERWTPGLISGFLAGSLFFQTLPIVLLLPGLAVLSNDLGDNEHWMHGLLATPLAALLYVLTTCLVVAVGKRLAMPRAQAGVFALRSAFGLRKWLSDKFMELSLTATNSLYATLYTSPWLRILGAKIGPRSEISTVSNIDPDLLFVGAESFVADLAVVGAARYHRGRVALGVTELGRRSFVGNASLVPGGTRLADDSLIGVQSVPPPHPTETGSSWLGSPAIFLPRRQESGDYDERLTFRPPARMVAGRLAVEALRVLLPSVLLYLSILINIRVILAMDAYPLWLQATSLPAVYLATSLLLTLITAALKWAVVGRYRPRVEPMWSHFVWRTELITALYENSAVPSLLHWLTGTPMLAPFLRLFGARIGSRIYMETSFLTEFDLVSVGDDASVAGWVSLQSHLFEDRVMKMSTVTVGPGCSIGPRSVVLYDAGMAEGSSLSALSLVMKGEQIPAKSRWLGIPAQLAD